MAAALMLAAVVVLPAQEPPAFPLPVETTQALVELRSSPVVQTRRLASDRVGTSS